MESNTPLVLAGAKYATRQDAVDAYNVIWGARHQGALDHTDIAILTKDANGELQMERHDSAGKHLAWGGALIGAALVIVAPPVGVAVAAASTGAIAGVGGLVGHFWRNIPKAQLNELSDLLQSGESGVVVVAVNHKGVDIAPLLGKALESKVIETDAGDLDAVFSKALADAQTNRSKAASAAH
jgi:uncharacterized membrane protein